MLRSSSLGDSAPQGCPDELGGPGGQADCHRSAKVDIGGGRTGLLSRIRSSSSITAVDKRGSNCNILIDISGLYYLNLLEMFR